MSEPARESSKRLTFEDVAGLDPDHDAGELDHGVWVPVTKNTWKHGELVANIAFLLKLWARANPGWSVSAADPGTKLSRDPDVLRGPDVAVVRADRVPTGRGADGWLDGAPDLVVEVIGDAQTVTSAIEKAGEYLAAGARVAWLVDAESGRVIVITAPDHTRVVGAAGEIEAGDALPGLRVLVADIFAR